MKTYIVEPLIDASSAKKLEGQFFDEDWYHLKIDHDADVYWNDNGQRRLLFHFRKGIVPDDMLNNALSVFKKDALKASSIRGTAGGAADPKKISPNVRDVVSQGKYRTKIIFKNGTVSNYYASNKVNSLIAGYFDKPKVAEKHDILKYGLRPCRTTLFTERNNAKWKTVLPLIEQVDTEYQLLEPEVHSDQLDLARITPQFQIADTAFSTLTVNYNWRTACHVDAGDYSRGYSVIMVAEEGQWTGGYLGYPRFGVMVDVRQGDFLLKDPHQQHCNTPIQGLSDDFTRLSFVLYYREKMQNCRPPRTSVPDTSQASPPNQHGGHEQESQYQLVPAKYPRRNIDVEVYIRPETTDIKVIKEVLLTNVYEKPKLDFYVSEGDRWLDLGGNIGTFALLALSRGATVVSCEPEQENLLLLEKNLLHNFPESAGKSWQLVPAAITPSTATDIDLYLCKGDYNKYRHTIYPKRGRQSIKVPNMSIYELLTKDKFNAIKIDIEGAEIDILEALSPEDYQGIDKMVYEYSFDIDPSIPRFLRIVDKLRTVFSMVHYTKVKEDELEYKHFPAATMVYCKK